MANSVVSGIRAAGKPSARAFSALAAAVLACAAAARGDGDAGLGYRLIAEAEAVVQKVLEEEPHCIDTGAGIRWLQDIRHDARLKAWEKAVAALGEPREGDPERERARRIVEWIERKEGDIDQRHAEAPFAWDSYWLDAEDIYFRDHAMHCLFPPADKAEAWRRVRDAAGMFRDEVPFAFTDGLAQVEIPRERVRKEWRCSDFDPYVPFFRVEPDWCLAEADGADLVAYEEDFANCIGLHDWKTHHLAVVRDGKIVWDAVFRKSWSWAEGFLWEDGILRLPDGVREELAREGFDGDIRLPESILKFH